MKREDILAHVDHTLLRPEATWSEAEATCGDAVEASVASVCLSPVFVERAAGMLQGRLPLCTVIGFPHGTSTGRVKALEAEDAVKRGADELDMVISLSMVKERRFSALLEEIRGVKEASQGRLLKVIVEACLLTEEEKIRLCHLVSESGADYIKTSTGFSSGGATIEDVRLFREELAPHVKIKAAGGIRTWKAAEAFLAAGADRIGSSALVPLAKAGV